LKYSGNAPKRAFLSLFQQAARLGRVKSRQDLTLGLIIAIVLIDAVLLAVVRLQYMASRGSDPYPAHRAFAMPTGR
jgi:hypothetical protein